MTTKDLLQVLIKGQNELSEDVATLITEQATLKGDVATLITGQTTLERELAVLREETRVGFKETHERLDKQGKQLAYLDDDAPTREEYDGLVKRVVKIEKVLSS